MGDHHILGVAGGALDGQVGLARRHRVDRRLHRAVLPRPVRGHHERGRRPRHGRPWDCHRTGGKHQSAGSQCEPGPPATTSCPGRSLDPPAIASPHGGCPAQEDRDGVPDLWGATAALEAAYPQADPGRCVLAVGCTREITGPSSSFHLLTAAHDFRTSRRKNGHRPSGRPSPPGPLPSPTPSRRHHRIPESIQNAPRDDIAQVNSRWYRRAGRSGAGRDCDA
jgi:hypothetical protein